MDIYFWIYVMFVIITSLQAAEGYTKNKLYNTCETSTIDWGEPLGFSGLFLTIFLSL